jgi:hypothetical protein
VRVGLKLPAVSAAVAIVRLMNISWTEIASISAAGLSAVAALGAWRAARRSSATAAAVAAIEHERWHAELTPEFVITFKRGEGDRGMLDVQLVGPLPLRFLDEVAIRIISSDDADRTPRHSQGPTQEEIDAQVWGPYQFTYGADGANVDGQSVAPVPMHVGRGRPFSIEKTRPPRWQEGQDVNQRWRDQWLRSPVRLLISCRRQGLEPWIIPYDVDLPYFPGARLR